VTDSVEASIPRYPRLLRRVRAVLIDTVLIYVVAILFWLMLLPLLDRFSTPVRLAYPILALLALEPLMVSLTGGSPGHHLMGIAIHDSHTGSRIGVIRALVRFILRTLFGWLSLILVLTTKKHQALHDMLCRTNVVLVDPDSLPKTEKFAERETEDPGFAYPSKIRRVVVIFLYLVLALFVIGIASAMLVSDTCMSTNRCTPLESLTILSLNGALILGFGSSIVYGWQARLYGCRRTSLASTGNEP